MTLLTVALVLSWVAIIGLGLMVLALTRQIGHCCRQAYPDRG